jgi:hypothetical protein
MFSCSWHEVFRGPEVHNSPEGHNLWCRVYRSEVHNLWCRV